jgi:hypothetical protein
VQSLTQIETDNMTTSTKALLVISVVGFVAGSIINFGNFNLHPSWTVALPAGAIAFGMFLISLTLEKEVAEYDAEHARKLQRLERSTQINVVGTTYTSAK